MPDYELLRCTSCGAVSAHGIVLLRAKLECTIVHSNDEGMIGPCGGELTEFSLKEIDNDDGN
jgi:hypothetical protein